MKTSGHEEAVARLLASIESFERLAVLRAGEGLGKTVVVRRALEETKGVHRRIARVVAPSSGVEMLAGLSAGLGCPVSPAQGRAAAWRALSDAVRLCRWQQLHPVLVVEDAHYLSDEADRRDLERLSHADPNPLTRLTVIQTFREPERRRFDDAESSRAADWQLVIRLPTLTLTETMRYVAEKLAAAGRSEPAFTPRALNRLHDLSAGVPRGLDRLGSLALMAGSMRGLEIITPDVVDGVLSEVASPL